MLFLSCVQSPPINFFVNPSKKKINETAYLLIFLDHNGIQLEYSHTEQI